MLPVSELHLPGTRTPNPPGRYIQRAGHCPIPWSWEMVLMLCRAKVPLLSTIKKAKWPEQMIIYKGGPRGFLNDLPLLLPHPAPFLSRLKYPFLNIMVLFKRPPDDKGSVWLSAVIGVFVALGGLLFGYDTGTISGVIAMKYWKDHFSTGYTDIDGNPGISANQAALIVSMLSVGTCVGSLSSPILADRLGRRWGLIVSAWVFNFGVILQVVSAAIPLLVAGRFFAGLGVGLLSALGE